jgi:hypothetical protein
MTIYHFDDAPRVTHNLAITGERLKGESPMSEANEVDADIKQAIAKAQGG